MSARDDRNIWPGFTYADALAMRDWLEALGFEKGICVPGETAESVRHSEMLWPEGGRVMVSTRGSTDAAFAEQHGGCYIVTQAPDEVFARAGSLGARIVRPIEDTEYGSRGFSLADAEGNTWSFGTYAGSEG